jgi:hypothetical protein
MFLDAIFKNLGDFLNDYREWHAFTEGFFETFCFWRAKHKLSGELLKDLKGEHHYYAFGRGAGFVALVVLGLVIVKVLRRKR